MLAEPRGSCWWELGLPGSGAHSPARETPQGRPGGLAHGRVEGGAPYLQWTTMGPALAAASGLSSTSVMRRSSGPADSGVWWSGQAEKRTCFTGRHSS